MMTATLKVRIPPANLLVQLWWFFRRKNYLVHLPESWPEVPANKLPALFDALALNIPDAQKIVHILRALLPIPSWVFLRIVPLDLVEKLKPCVVWLLVSPITAPLLPSVQLGRCRWMLPEPAGRDMTLGQYLQIEQELYQFRTSNNVSRLLACILRKDDTHTQTLLNESGLLPHLNSTQVDTNAAIIETAKNAGIAWYVFMYWMHQRDTLAQDFPDFFTHAKSEKSSETDWESIPARIAETQVFGNVYQTLNTPLRIYLAYANAKAKENREPTLQELIRANHQKFTA